MNDNKYLFCIPTPNGGSGNQLVGIKEALIISYYSDRIFLFPPITQHFIINHFKRNDRYDYKYWEFNTIFNYNNNYLDVLENKEILNDIHTIYYTSKANQPVPVECVFEKIDNKIWNCKNKKYICAPCKLNSKEDYDFFKNIHDKVLVINFTYNITNISICGINGCRKCNLNSNFEIIYKDICSKLDFSQKIKKFGDDFINNNFNNNEFISVHLRYTDYFKGLSPEFKNLKDLTKTFDEEDINNYLIQLSKEQNISVENIFIATPVPYRIKNSSLKVYKLLNNDDNYDELESFIEQYICCKSKLFIYCGGETDNHVHQIPWKFHKRSSWSSFVTDYRNYLLKIDPETNILLPEIFGNDL
tara:strand:+ start:705 stop:1781 length:1077 start_codon:yes stop_codon:yes gene_type:complete